MTQTQIRGAWPGKPTPVEVEKKTTRGAEKPINMGMIKRTKEPYVAPPFARYKSKFSDIFDGAKVGDCWQCSPYDLDKLRRALERYCKNNGVDATIKRNSKCPDGLARLWVCKKDHKDK